MKRRLLIAHIEQHNCLLAREGSKHSIYYCRATEQTSAVPRHSEIDDFLVLKICRDLGIPSPAKH